MILLFITAGALVTIVSHGCKYRVVALKYGEEKEPRFLVASDASWRERGHYPLRMLYAGS